MHLLSVPWAVLASVLSTMRSYCEVGLAWNTECANTVSFEIIILLETWQWQTQVTPIVTLFAQLFCCSTHEELVGHVLLIKFPNFAIMLCDYTRSCRLWQCMLCAVNMYIALLLSMHRNCSHAPSHSADGHLHLWLCSQQLNTDTLYNFWSGREVGGPYLM